MIMMMSQGISTIMGPLLSVWSVINWNVILWHGVFRATIYLKAKTDSSMTVWRWEHPYLGYSIWWYTGIEFGFLFSWLSCIGQTIVSCCTLSSSVKWAWVWALNSIFVAPECYLHLNWTNVLCFDCFAVSLGIVFLASSVAKCNAGTISPM